METHDARKEPLGKTQALRLVRDVREIWSRKGRSVVHADLREERPGPAELAGLLLGPTGNLRAPTLRVGGALIVGFDPDTYERLLG